MSTPSEQHRATSPNAIGCFVLTVSDTRTPENDTGGAVIRELLAGGGHTVVGSRIVRDEPVDVTRVVREACADPRIQVVILTGGTGITSRDSTFEAVEALLDKRLPGFGELFRVLSYEQVGAAGSSIVAARTPQMTRRSERGIPDLLDAQRIEYSARGERPVSG